MLKDHEVVEARFGLEALIAVSKQPFHVVVSDISLQDMEADELYRRLLEEGHAGQILFLASRLDPPPRDRYDRRLPVIYRPFDAEVLSARIESMIGQSAPQWDVK